MQLGPIQMNRLIVAQFLVFRLILKLIDKFLITVFNKLNILRLRVFSINFNDTNTYLKPCSRG